MEFPDGRGIPLSLHNLWVGMLMLLMSAWLLQVAYRLFKAHRIQWRMRRSDMGPLYLDGLSLYAADLQEIIRQHFNQLLRIRPTVPARDIAKVKVLAHLQPESLRCSKVEADSTTEKLRLVFKVDSLQPFKVQLFGGPRYHDLLQQLAQDDVDVNNVNLWDSMSQLHPAGNGQKVTIVEDWSSIRSSVDEEAASTERIPLVICLWTPSEVMRTLTFAEVHGVHDGDLPIEVMQQVVVTSGVARKILGIFGTEEEAGLECMVCFDRRRNVIVLPCRHCSVCLSCLRSMRDERCPLCRSAFSAYLLLPLQTGQVPLE